MASAWALFKKLFELVLTLYFFYLFFLFLWSTFDYFFPSAAPWLAALLTLPPALYFSLKNFAPVKD